MAQLVLGLGAVTAVVGAYLFTYTFGARSRAEAEPGQPVTRLPPSVVFIHPWILGGALVTWIVYLGTEERALAWTTLVVLLGAALTGASLLVRTWRSKHEPEVTAEARTPTVAIVAYGLLLAATMVVVFLVCLGVGEPIDPDYNPEFSFDDTPEAARAPS